MKEKRGVLCLDDCGEGWPALERAQAALLKARGAWDWVCVTAGGASAGVAVALAAQLNVDRLVLTHSRLFERRNPFERGPAARLERYARRNLALVAAEVVLVGAGEREIRGFAAQLNGRRFCALETGVENFLTAEWAEINENNLLLAAKCV